MKDTSKELHLEYRRNGGEEFCKKIKELLGKNPEKRIFVEMLPQDANYFMEHMSDDENDPGNVVHAKYDIIFFGVVRKVEHIIKKLEGGGFISKDAFWIVVSVKKKPM